MGPILPLLSQTAQGISEFATLCHAVEAGDTPLLAVNIPQVPRLHLCALLREKTGKPLLYIAADDQSARRAAAMLTDVLGGGVFIFPARELSLYNVEGRSHEWEQLRIEGLKAALSGDTRAIVATVEGLMQPLCPPHRFLSATLKIGTGDVLPVDKLLEFLVNAGYVKSGMTEGAGQFSRRGGIVDVFSPGSDNPLRIEFFGDEIDSLSPFDPLTQRRLDPVSKAVITPAREHVLDQGQRERLASKLEGLIRSLKRSRRPNAAALIETVTADRERLLETGDLPVLDRYLPLLYDEPAFLSDYMPQSVTVMADPKSLFEQAAAIERRMADDIEALLERALYCPGVGPLTHSWADLCARLEKARLVAVESFSSSRPPFKIKSLIDLTSRPWPGFSDELSICREAAELAAKGYACIVAAADEERMGRLSAIFSKEGVVAPVSAGLAPLKGQIVLCYGNLGGGVIYDGAKVAIFGEEGTAKKKSPSQKRPDKKADAKNRLKSYADLSPGDYVVHQSHGIGQFISIENLTVDGVSKDYIKVRYAGADLLYIPCNQLDLLSRYIAPRTERMKLSRMGGAEWGRTRSRVKAAVKELARELIALYAQRQAVPGYPFPSDDDLQREFEARFPYEETEDQRRCSEEIKRDMEKPVPMDRLLCGDVGFGKTEVAMRAIFKCISDGRQAALLVPTTLLARQHFATLTARLSGYPVNVGILSRYNAGAGHKKVIEGLKSGTIDVVVGTHRLIQKDVEFRDLGLLVVDEEQRFGVGHKERLKEMAKSVDCLTLTATPIPRTLNMAMSGIRDMSLMEEPPGGRHPVTTYVSEYDPAAVADAIRREMRRGGQCYFLHNRTESIEKTAAAIRALVPEASVLFAHGRMGEGEITSVMSRFIGGEGDVLVCTTIIEAGIDIPNVNTLIVERADLLGLSQLYQIRGRVGRSDRRAVAYLMYRPDRALPEEAVKRLSAIREFTEFGSGFKIALRDLEIRGAGNILGAEQHGHMESVGYDMYMKLLSEAVSEETGQNTDAPVECAVDILIDAYIPARYIESAEQRIEMYRKIASILRDDDASDVKDELIDRFGDIPKSVENLIEVALLRNRAGRLKILEINQKSADIIFIPKELSPESITALSASFMGRLRFFAGKKPGFSVALNAEQDIMSLATDVLLTMEGAI